MRIEFNDGIGYGGLIYLLTGFLKIVANLILIVMMLGAAYTHYALNDELPRILPALLFFALSLYSFYTLLHKTPDKHPRSKSS